MNLLTGLLISLLSACAFGTAGTLAKGLLTAGWTPGAAAVWRMAVGALALLLPAAIAMRGRWGTLRKGWRSMVLFGLVAVAGCQLTYFFAVERLDVAVALLIEYSGVLLVVLWHWLRRGKRPRALTIGGTALALGGLALVLDVFGPVQVDPIGVMWALVAAAGLATYFVLSEDESAGVPPLALATGGLAVGAVTLLLANGVGLLDLSWSAVEVTLAGAVVPWWVVVLAIGLVAAALAYATGIMGVRRLGSKLASFVGLAEVLFAVAWAWLLLGERPAPIQLLGGVLVLAGVVAVRLDEDPRPASQPATAERLGTASGD